jgi:2-C-methyl-D-erythritol 4-phosphate cytidylyltransferase / 2-C-methyl-D-erythritol 2,4-cyclodiphosphate synthase
VPKQYLPVGHRSALARVFDVFIRHPRIDLVQVVIGAGDEPWYREAVGEGSSKVRPPVVGGETRQRSVQRGLRAIAAEAPDQVVIHDAARPFITAEIIDRVLGALTDAPGAIVAVPVADTLKRGGPDGRIAATLDRTGLWRAQTPQAFRFRDILAAHETAVAAGHQDMTDDAAVAEWAGLDVRLVMGSEANRKLTTAEDMAAFDMGTPAHDVRVGNGFDVHRLVAGDHVWLCGLKIPHTQSLEGHSDADVALHALTDALLGAAGDGDIGQHFPPSDPRWKGAPSHLFVREALARVRERGGTIGNVDITVLCEAPKIAPHRAAMRQRIAELLAIDIARVSVKATTTEGLGFTGRREGISALATATVLFGSPSAA